VYVADTYNNRVQYFTQNGSFIGKWGTIGSGMGEFHYPVGITIGGNGNVFVADYDNHRVHVFTASGSFLTMWGYKGSGAGQFHHPRGVGLSLTEARIYVAERDNYRVQYFNRNEPAVAPASLGRVKALFR
jgi:DNA-binding beta-propeller fold protein YncE